MTPSNAFRRWRHRMLQLQTAIAKRFLDSPRGLAETLGSDWRADRNYADLVRCRHCNRVYNPGQKRLRAMHLNLHVDRDARSNRKKRDARNRDARALARRSPMGEF